MIIVILIVYSILAKNKILVLQIETRDNILLSKACEHNRKYAEKMGYDYKLITKTPTRPPYWEKVFLINKYLRNYNAILWLDSDAVIYNTEIRVEDLLNQFEINDGILGCNDPPPWKAQFMASVFIVTNTKMGRKIIHDWCNLFKPERWVRENNEWKCDNCPWAGDDYEQGCFNTQIIPKYNKTNIKLLPWYVFNSYLQNDVDKETSFTLHFTGIYKIYLETFFISNKF